MKAKIVFVLLVMTVIIISMVGCEKESQTNPDFTGKLTSHTACKNLKSAVLETETPDTLSCVEYIFDEAENKLTVKHINAGFNCCPESLYCDISLENDTIYIHEHETDGMCNCNCLFDLDIEMKGVEAKKYQVQFVEPYAVDQEELEFEMNLITDKVGSVCVIRKRYPWGIFN